MKFSFWIIVLKKLFIRHEVHCLPDCVSKIIVGTSFKDHEPLKTEYGIRDEFNSLIGCLRDWANIEQTSSKYDACIKHNLYKTNIQQTSSKRRANIELAQAGLLEPRPLAQMKT